jgi:5-methyltetrahydropteroyltriglutamate--homocysteine methyltransferase
VGSYPLPEWLAALPSEQARLDATRVVFDIQRQAGIDLPTDGELYRFDVNHPDTNGMIDYFIRPMAGVRAQVGRSDHEAFAGTSSMRFRRKAAGVVEAELGEGSLNLLADCELAASVARGPFKFTVTSPYMLARTLLDRHYGGFEELLMALAGVLAQQVAGLPCTCLQVDEANIPGNPADGPIAAAAINRVLDGFTGLRAVHLCFGNYGGQTIQKGEWRALTDFLNRLHVDHLILEMAHRSAADLEALRDVDPRIRLGIGVVDVKVNYVETPDEIAGALERAENVLGRGRVSWIHPDCGFWMLKRSVADRKIAVLAKGRDLYLGRG